MPINNYKSAFDLQQEQRDLEAQKSTAESVEEIEMLDETIKNISERINGLLNQSSDGFILSYD